MARDLYLHATLGHPGDVPLHRQPVAEGIFQLLHVVQMLPVLGAEQQGAGRFVDARDGDLDGIAYVHGQLAVAIREGLGIHDSLGLSTEIDEDPVGAYRHHRTVDLFTHLRSALRRAGVRVLEFTQQRCEIFFVAHGPIL